MNGTPNPHSARDLVRHIRASDIYRDYQRAFETTTHLPLSFHSIDELDLALHGSKHENPFCALMAAKNRTCAQCLSLQAELERTGEARPRAMTCFAGLCEASVPVLVGENVIGFLHTGQVLLHAPTKLQLARTTRLLFKWGAEVDLKRVEEAYFHTRVIRREELAAVQRLLATFAQHLSMVSNQIMVAAQQPDPPAVERAKAYIAEHVDEPLTLTSVGRAVNASAYYFCKLFRRATGLHFIDYVARVRVERAKSLLLNPQMRISEAAYAAGFQSLSQFNRTFKRVVGEQPRMWREKLAR